MSEYKITENTKESNYTLFKDDQEYGVFETFLEAITKVEELKEEEESKEEKE